MWALKCTHRLDKYNVWATVAGGGTTGQAEALALAVAKAVCVHEPALKTSLRNGTSSRPTTSQPANPAPAGCIARDPRAVERKKPGHLKARKKPAWVKR
jgi:small subunit ribosomal protein S9